MVRAAMKLGEQRPGWLDSAVYGLKWEAKRQSLSLHTFDVERLARNVVSHAVSSGYIVERTAVDEAVAREKRKADVHLGRACAAEVAADRQRSKVQAALSAWPDRAAAESLAAECGLLLLPEGREGG